MEKLPPGLQRKKGVVSFDGLDLEGAAARLGTPAYVYSERRVRERLAELRRAYAGTRPLICYALKSNSSLALGRLLAREGLGAEVVSGGELWLARKAGFPAKKLIFSGLGKTRGELREGLKAGILAFNVESRQELEALQAEALRLRARAPVVLRINPDIDAGTHPHITTGRAADKFGLPIPEALDAYRWAAAQPGLKVLGLHAHLGSQILSPGPYVRSARLLASLARGLEREGLPVSLLDAGGGFGLPYDGGKSLDLEAAARTLEPLARPGRTLIIEPGRYLSAEAGLLLARVQYVKPARKGSFVVLDAGMNDLIRPALYGARHPLVPVHNRPGPLEDLEIVGPICESADRFGRVRAPRPAPGDLWAILLAGSYGYAMASQYNGRPRAPEAWFGKGLRLTRRRESYKDLARTEL